VKISVIIPSYNASRTIRQCLKAATSQAYSDYEVIVVDDASTDETAQLAEKFPVRLIRQSYNQGAAAARNRGAKEGKGELFVFTDSDCVPPRDWLQKITGYFKDPQAVSVSGMYQTENKNSPQARFIGYDIDFRLRQEPDDAAIFGTYNCAIRREIFSELGGFDEHFPGITLEDTDFGFRLGYRYPGRMLLAKDSFVGHYHREKLFLYLGRQFLLSRGRVWLLGTEERSETYASKDSLIQLPIPIVMILFLLAARRIPVELVLGIEAGLAALFLGCNWRFLNSIPSQESFRFRFYALGMQWLRNIVFATGVWMGFMDRIRGRSSVYTH